MRRKAPGSNFSCPPLIRPWMLMLRGPLLDYKGFLLDFLLDYKPCLEYSPKGLPPKPGRSPQPQQAQPWLNPSHSSPFGSASARLPHWAKDPFPRCSLSPVMIPRLNLTYIKTNCFFLPLDDKYLETLLSLIPGTEPATWVLGWHWTDQ